MNKELACRLAEGNTLYEKCLSANAIFEANSSDWNKPFSKSDLAAIRMTDWMGTATQRERDIVVVYELLEQCHRELFITAGVLGEELSPTSEKHVKMLCESLRRLGILNFLTDDLRQDIFERYCYEAN
jgi:hypothetical protein